MKKTVYTPYTYLIGWSKLNKWYYGVRYATKTKCLYESGCHPHDFWITYHTSSDIVTAFRKEHGEPDVIQIRKVFSNAEDAVDWELKVLQRMDVVTQDKWINGTDISGPPIRCGKDNPNYIHGRTNDPEYQRERYQKYRETHPERIQESHRKYRENNIEKIRERERKSSQKWQKENPEKKREADRKWYKNNLEKARESSQKWQKENRKKRLEQQRKYREENREKKRETDRKYREENRERVQETQRKWREKNREKILERVLKWQKNNPEKRRENSRKYRAKKKLEKTLKLSKL
jgi:hypothetical protein